MEPTSGDRSFEVLEAIRRRATELYQSSGAIEGKDAENWRRAEAQIIRESGMHLARRAVVINVQGVVYTGEYDFRAAAGYTSGEWKAGDRIPIRLAGDKLFLRRRNGLELETTIVKRLG
jgi:hypothetical protein